MGIKGFDGNLSEESKKALQSETWQKVRDSMKEKKRLSTSRLNAQRKMPMERFGTRL